ncbi:hypothetical protein [Streptomyces nigra]|uniref:hypothetical protein n=1 Tax=Streptomyces nigra TaxID=1827580 RepID=UPI00380F8247
MYDEQNHHNAAAHELRRRVSDGLARARLSKTQLAQKAGLGRTTVQLAFQADGPVPSPETVATLARALKLPIGELLELQRTASEESLADESGAPGRPIGQWEPHELEVHPAGPGSALSPDEPATRALPGYVLREHDQVLAEAVRDVAAGRSRIVVLVGTSSTGKTRACWEAVQPLSEKGWRLWHPFDPTRAEAALEELCRVEPRTVVWLNEAQHYLGDQAAGERISAAVHQLLIDEERGPVLVLGTLWPEYARQYTALPNPGREDPHSRVRELLAGRTLAVPEAFDTAALATAAALAEGGDWLLADALTRARGSRRITQDLAGAPELLRRYEQATAPARALLDTAMDARRLGVGLHLPQAFLTDAALGYLTDADHDQLPDDWPQRAFAELAEPVHGKQAPLRRVNPRTPRRSPTPTTKAPRPAPPAGPAFRLADYLEQHGRTTRDHQCPGDSFWHAAHARLTDPDDLHILALAAERRHRLQWAHHLRLRANHYHPDAPLHLAREREEAGDREGAEALYREAADHGSTEALWQLAVIQEEAGDREGAEALARQAADHGSTDALWQLAEMREEGDREGATALYRQAADRGSTYALLRLTVIREEAGDRKGAEALARLAADRGSTGALWRLAERRKTAGDREGAEALYREVAGHGNTDALWQLAEMREEAGHREGAEILYRQAADQGDTDALRRLAEMREEAGDKEGAEVLARQLADRGSTDALGRLAVIREEAGDREGAEVLARQVADCGSTDALLRLAAIREEAGDREGAEALYRQAADRGDTDAIWCLAVMREDAGDQQGAEVLARQVADRGSTNALCRLAEIREEARDQAGAEVLYRHAADRGSIKALWRLAEMREDAGDHDGAEALARQIGVRGSTDALRRLAEMRERAGDRVGAEALYRQAADRGSTYALRRLAGIRERGGDRVGAEALYQQAADGGSTYALWWLAGVREQAGDREGAEALYRQAADRGRPELLRSPAEITALLYQEDADQEVFETVGLVTVGRDTFLRLWPYGLDPDGTPTNPWQPSADSRTARHLSSSVRGGRPPGSHAGAWCR